MQLLLPAAAFLLSHAAGQLPRVCAGAKKLVRCVVLGRNVFFFATEKAQDFVFEFSCVFLELRVCCVVQGNTEIEICMDY